MHKAVIGDETRPYKYDGILGMKTGYTVNAARSCLVAAAERGRNDADRRSLPVGAGSFVSGYVIQLLDFGFDNFKMVDLGMKAGDVVGEAAVKEGKRGKIDVTVKSDVKATVELMEGQKFSDDPSDYDFKIESDQLTAPVKKGEKAGRMVVYRGDSAVAQLDMSMRREEIRKKLRWEDCCRRQLLSRR